MKPPSPQALAEFRSLVAFVRKEVRAAEPPPREFEAEWASVVEKGVDDVVLGEDRAAPAELRNIAFQLAALLCPIHHALAVAATYEGLLMLVRKHGGGNRRVEGLTPSRERGDRRGSRVPPQLSPRMEAIALSLSDFLTEKNGKESFLYSPSNSADAASTITLAVEFDRYFEGRGSFDPNISSLTNLCIAALLTFSTDREADLYEDAMSLSEHLARDVKPTLRSKVSRFLRGY